MGKRKRKRDQKPSRFQRAFMIIDGLERAVKVRKLPDGTEEVKILFPIY